MAVRSITVCQGNENLVLRRIAGQTRERFALGQRRRQIQRPLRADLLRQRGIDEAIHGLEAERLQHLPLLAVAGADVAALEGLLLQHLGQRRAGDLPDADLAHWDSPAVKAL